jgi:2-iminobutanoate/2-iminopropanoate deaminase
MKREIISTSKAPGAVGPYSQAVRTGNFVFVAGQVAIDPTVDKLIEGDVAAQTHQVLANLSAVLEVAGSSLGRVVKTTVFLKDMGQFQAMNAVYAEFFPSDPPARSTIEVAALPLGALVEIEAIAVAE